MGTKKNYNGVGLGESNGGVPRSTIYLFAQATDTEADAVRQSCSHGSYNIVAVPDPEAICGDADIDARILLIGNGRAKDAAKLLSRYRPFQVDLLIAHDEAVLACEDLLQNCANVLFAPYDEQTLLQQLNELMTGPDAEPEIYHNIIGRSPQIRQLRQVMQTIAAYDAPVLIKGETGTGKELVARGIHYSSTRRDMPFVPVNCGALSDDLLLAELFGYEKGAFTDAKRAHAGLVAQAQGGVLFLDEVDCLSPKGQAALLRFLQEREYRPLGSESLNRADVRIITATNKDIEALIAQQRFREDLYFRIHLLGIHLPPLRERTGDVAVLAEHILMEIAQRHEVKPKWLHPLTLRWMSEYAWPGNVRELENYLYRLFVLSKGSVLCVPGVKADPVMLVNSPQTPAIGSDQLLSTFRDEKTRILRAFEKDYLQRAMKAAGGNISLAARRAGKERQAFRRLLKKHGITRDLHGLVPSRDD